MTTEEMIERAKAFSITVELKSPDWYRVTWGNTFTSIPERMLERTLTTAAKAQAKRQPEMAALLPFVPESED